VIVLVGFMGAGKTTVGRALAARLGLAFADSDEAVGDAAEIFERKGEEAFRAREAEVAIRLLTGDRARVVALGGGAPTLPEVASALRDPDLTVVHLDVPLDEALRRCATGGPRPMLQRKDPEALYAARRPVYEEVSSFSVAADRNPAEIVEEIVGRARPAFPVEVPVAGAPYRVYVGEGIAARAAELLPASLAPEKALLVTHPAIADVAAAVAASLEDRRVEVAVEAVPEGEGSKSVDAAARLWERAADLALHRGDLVAAVGGGVLTDLAGFVASTFNRGMPLLHLPTTLLAQVDAAVGGKTAINLPQGKNLVGTFHQPAAVVCDVAVLRSLPQEELRSGLAEAVKCGLIADVSLLGEIEERASDLLGADPGALARLVRRAVAIKAEIVASDERDRGRRAVLNYGHTFAHAIEATAGYGAWRHGEAVAVGMMAAAFLARELGRIDEDTVALHERVLGSLGLPVRAELDLDALEEAWKRDKKYERGVRFVLLAEAGRAEAGVAAPRETVARALERLRR